MARASAERLALMARFLNPSPFPAPLFAEVAKKYGPVEVLEGGSVFVPSDGWGTLYAANEGYITLYAEAKLPVETFTSLRDELLSTANLDDGAIKFYEFTIGNGRVLGTNRHALDVLARVDAGKTPSRLQRRLGHGLQINQVRFVSEVGRGFNESLRSVSDLSEVTVSANPLQPSQYIVTCTIRRRRWTSLERLIRDPESLLLEVVDAVEANAP